MLTELAEALPLFGTVTITHTLEMVESVKMFNAIKESAVFS
jgi:hypothetical protein